MEGGTVFAHWGEFSLLVGTAAAALLALLFVAVSLGTGFLTDARAAATRAFYSPIVIHYGAVLFLSAVTLVPAHRPLFYAVLTAATGLIGLAVSTVTTIQILRHPDWSRFVVDRLGYGLLPIGGYTALIVAAVLIQQGQPVAADVVGGALLLLLLVNIRNAWDLMLSMVRRNANEISGRPPG